MDTPPAPPAGTTNWNTDIPNRLKKCPKLNKKEYFSKLPKIMELWSQPIETKKLFSSKISIINRQQMSQHSDPNALLWDGYTPLTEAISQGNAEEVQRLLVMDKADINRPDGHYSPQTPLIAAIAKKDITIFKLLIEHGADVNKKADGIYPIHAACRMCSLEIVEILISKGSLVNVMDNYGYLPITIALNGIKSARDEWVPQFMKLNTEEIEKETLRKEEISENFRKIAFSLVLAGADRFLDQEEDDTVKMMGGF